jgi:hypothetical protein
LDDPATRTARIAIITVAVITVLAFLHNPITTVGAKNAVLVAFAVAPIIHAIITFLA